MRIWKEVQEVSWQLIMPRELYEKILEASKLIDQRFASISHDDLLRFEDSFVVPASHPCSVNLSNYSYRVGSVEQAFDSKPTLAMVDKGLQSLSWLQNSLPQNAHVIWLAPREEETKEQHWLDAFIANEIKEHPVERIVAIGGGIITNASGYIAERLQCELIYVPTTVLAMSDGSIGGKVRANLIEGGVYHKHYYKTFYEPNFVVIDPRFLETLPDKQISVGLGEIIKHGVYQSRALLEYMASDAFDPFKDKIPLLKSILWAAALKAVCLNIDPEETKDGSHIIMRGGHEASDKIEEASRFTIPHGTAVSLAIRKELADSDDPLLSLVDSCFDKFSIRT